MCQNSQDSHPTLAESLDGAKLVVNSDAHGIVLAWFGGLTINGYTPEGKGVVTWSMGQVTPDVADAAQSIENHIANEYFPS